MKGPIFTICASVSLAVAVYVASPLLGKAHVDRASAQNGCAAVIDGSSLESMLLSPIPFGHVCFKSGAPRQ